MYLKKNMKHFPLNVIGKKTREEEHAGLGEAKELGMPSLPASLFSYYSCITKQEEFFLCERNCC